MSIYGLWMAVIAYSSNDLIDKKRYPILTQNHRKQEKVTMERVMILS